MKFQDWPKRLNNTIEAARNRAFEWGQHDCCLFVADCADAMTGSEIAKKFRGKYKTAIGANGVLKKNDGLESICNKYFHPIIQTLAGRGDIALLDYENSPLGIVDLSGKRIAVTGEAGLVFYPMAKGVKFWRAE